MMRLPFIVLALIFGASMSLVANAQSFRPQFEVASIKPNVNGTESEFEVAPGGRLVAINRTLSDLIFQAYKLRPYQIPHDPEWITSDHYDIEAKADGNPSYNEMMVMFQNLLQDRFNLKVHWGMMEQPVFLITAAKGGLKLKPSTAPCVRFDQTVSIRPVDEQTRLPNCRNMMSAGEPRRWIAEAVGMKDVTFMLSCECLLGRKVIDMTAFTGRFDFTLEFAADSLKTDAVAPSLLTMFQDQLGLKVDSGRAPVEVLVIDSVQRPAEN
jgi:uncharacterized protein (TIGR03435 family)